MGSGLSSIIEPRLHTFSDAKSLILDICNKEDMRIAGRFVVMIEILWKNNNNIVWNNDKGMFRGLVCKPISIGAIGLLSVRFRRVIMSPRIP